VGKGEAGKDRGGYVVAGEDPFIFLGGKVVGSAEIGLDLFGAEPQFRTGRRGRVLDAAALDGDQGGGGVVSPYFLIVAVK
jgi:hypothetical protein